MVTVYGIVPGSEADKAGIKAGDILHTVNGNEIKDVLDYRFYLTETRIELSLEHGGAFYQVIIHKEMYADIGLEFETYLMDEKRSCRNRCIFCFIDQLPENMRESLYFKDDDSRLSFLLGNYITLTNLHDEDIERIIKMRISPVNVSVHTTNPDLRVRMMKNKNAGVVLKYLKVLADAGISLNCQIVLCKGINDGEELLRTMKDLSSLYPAVASVSVVPAGLTKYREKLYPLSPFSPEESGRVIDEVTEFGDMCWKKYGTRLFYPGDELYIKSGRKLPEEDFYEDYAQIENGVGMIASMKGEFAAALEIAPKIKNEKTVSVATGYAAFDFISELCKEAENATQGLKINVFKIRNDFFGENITVAGLLTGKDIFSQLEKPAKEGKLGMTLYLPKVTLRAEGDLFLDGMTPDELSEKLCVPIEFVSSDGGEFYDKLTEES